MKCVIGPPPENSDFNPEAECWFRLKEPSIYFMLLCIGLPAGLLLGCLFYFVAASWLDFSFEQLIEDLDYWVFVLPIALIVIHEGCHALLHPGWGLSQQTIYGCLPKGMALYAVFDGPTSRTRTIMIMIAPFIFLSIMPLLIAFFYPAIAQTASFTAILNAASSGGDIVNTAVLLRGVPAGAIVRNKGWPSYWRPN